MTKVPRWLHLGTAVVLAGCSVAPTPTPEPPVDRGPFSAKDRRAAEVLSLAGGAIDGASDPFSRAIVCESALGVLTDRLNETDVIGAKEREVFVQVRAYFEQQVRANAPAEATAQDVERAIEDARLEARRRSASSARTGLACIKSLEEGA